MSVPGLISRLFVHRTGRIFIVAAAVAFAGSGPAKGQLAGAGCEPGGPTCDDVSRMFAGCRGGTVTVAVRMSDSSWSGSTVGLFIGGDHVDATVRRNWAIYHDAAQRKGPQTVCIVCPECLQLCQEVDCSPVRDQDSDGVRDRQDNCPSFFNPEQTDDDEDGVGNPCDNCVATPNPDQLDENHNGIGDACEPGGPVNNHCGNPLIADDGTQNFSTEGATTDGPDEPLVCNFFDRSQIDKDIWYCYTASCAGEMTVSLCGSSFDTKMAVYDGCGCPESRASACSDDDCGTAVGNVDSRVTVPVVAGEQYTIRVGGFNGSEGNGRLTIACGVDTCGESANDCFAESADGTTGCADRSCCETVCAADQFCCDVEWDSFCASVAGGLCTDGFPSCQPKLGSCMSARPEPGCGLVDCCNEVCQDDPYCCIIEWDGNCAGFAASRCFLTCGAGSGDCFTAHLGPGCNDVDCCAQVCPDDPFCCVVEWDVACVEKAQRACR